MTPAELVLAETVKLSTLRFPCVVLGIEEDCNGAPGGTTDYDGRALAFMYETEGRTIRVLVEDVTLDPEVPS
jgi:hypothetical protein